jgi:hypothetical protein
MDINEICTEVVRNVSTALGCAVVDLSSGLLIGVSHKVPYFTASYLDAAAAAAVDMVRGRTVSTVEQMISNIRGKEDSMMIEEIQITTKNTYHFLAVVPEKPNSMVVLVNNRKANLGMGWSAVRLAMPKLAPLCPS